MGLLDNWFDYNNMDAKIEAGRNRATAPAATNTGNRAGDTLAAQERFTEALSKDPNMNWLAAMGMGARGTVDKGLVTGGLMNAFGSKPNVPDEALRKIDYAAEKLHPIAHTVGRVGGAALSAADWVASLMDGAALATKLGKFGAVKPVEKVSEAAAPFVAGSQPFSIAGKMAQGLPELATEAGAAYSTLGRAGFLPRAANATMQFAGRNPIAGAAAAAGLGGLASQIGYNIYTGNHYPDPEEPAPPEQPPQRAPDWYDEMSGISGLSRETLQDMVRREGGIRLSTLQALSGMKGRAPTAQQQAASQVNGLLTTMLAQAQESGDTERAKELAAMVAKFSAQIAANDEMIASEVQKLLVGDE